jgi:hypothetical protein
MYVRACETALIFLVYVCTLKSILCDWLTLCAALSPCATVERATEKTEYAYLWERH